MGNLLSSSKKEDPKIIFVDSEEKEEEESIEISCLPYGILHSIVEKLDYWEYGILRQTNSQMNQMCESKSFFLECHFPQISVKQDEIKLCKKYDYEYDAEKTREPVAWKDLDPAAWIHTRLAIVECPLSSEKAEELLNFFEKERTSIGKIRFEERVFCQPEQFIQLIKKVGCEFLDCRQSMEADFFDKHILSLPNLNMVSCNFSNQQLMQWRGENMYVGNDVITATTINRFLKQWKRRERDFASFHLEFDTSIGQRDFEVMLAGLDANPIWTPELHSQSFISRIPLAEFHETATNDHEHLYSIWRPDDIENIRIIRLCDARIEVDSHYNEIDLLYEYLTNDQQTLLEECLCEDSNCIHKRFLATGSTNIGEVQGGFASGFWFIFYLIEVFTYFWRKITWNN